MPACKCALCNLAFPTRVDLRDHAIDQHGVDAGSHAQKALAVQASYAQHAAENIVNKNGFVNLALP